MSTEVNGKEKKRNCVLKLFMEVLKYLNIQQQNASKNHQMCLNLFGEDNYKYLVKTEFLWWVAKNNQQSGI